MKKDLQNLVKDRLSRGKLVVNPDGTITGPRGPVGTPNSDGYLTVTIYVGGGSKNQVTRTVKAHQIVWLAFNCEIPEGMEINHKDADKANNRIDNLELVSRLGNMAHAKKMGLTRDPMPRLGSDNSQALLTEEQVGEIRGLVKSDGRRLPNNKGAGSGWTLQALADKYGVSRGTIHDIVKGKTWKHT